MCIMHWMTLSERTAGRTTSIHHRWSRTNDSEISWNLQEHAGQRIPSIIHVLNQCSSSYAMSKRKNRSTSTTNNWNWLVQLNLVNSKRKSSKRNPTEKLSKGSWRKSRRWISLDTFICSLYSYPNSGWNAVQTTIAFFWCYSFNDWSRSVICWSTKSRRSSNASIRWPSMTWWNRIELNSGVSRVNCPNRSASSEWIFANISSKSMEEIEQNPCSFSLPCRALEVCQPATLRRLASAYHDLIAHEKPLDFLIDRLQKDQLHDTVSLNALAKTNLFYEVSNSRSVHRSKCLFSSIAYLQELSQRREIQHVDVFARFVSCGHLKQR